MKPVNNTKANKKVSAEYLLAGKLFCGKCGKLMNGESVTSQNVATCHYYKCYGRTILHSCDKHDEQKQPLEALVVKTVVNNVLTDANIDMIAKKVHELMVRESEDNSVMVALEANLSETKKAIGNIIKAIEAGIFTDTTKNRLVTLEAEKNCLTVNIEKERISHPILPKEAIIFWLDSFRHCDMANEKYRRQIIDAFVHSVYVYDRDGGKTVKIICNMSENNEFEISCSEN